MKLGIVFLSLVAISVFIQSPRAYANLRYGGCSTTLSNSTGGTFPVDYYKCTYNGYTYKLPVKVYFSDMRNVCIEGINTYGDKVLDVGLTSDGTGYCPEDDTCSSKLKVKKDFTNRLIEVQLSGHINGHYGPTDWGWTVEECNKQD